MLDPFAILGLTRGASAAEIKRAYRKLAMSWHPDRNPSREAEERFKHIKLAYELALDPERLAAWDAAQAEAGGAPETEAATESGDDGSAHLTLHLDLEEAAHGCTKTIALASARVCPNCAGDGRHEHAHSLACAECMGVGRTRRGGRCEACAGRGYVRITRCAECGGRGWLESTRQVEVRIPPAMLPGERLRLARQHRPHLDKPASDLFVAIALRPHPLFALDGRDLECTMPVGIFRLLHGGPIEVPTLAGRRQIDIEPYPGHDLDYVFPGFGYPGRHGKGAGKLRLRLTPVFPRRLDEAERKLLLRLDKAMLADAAHCAPELAAWAKTVHGREGPTAD